MAEFLIKEIDTIGYERFVTLEAEGGQILKAHFMEIREYLEKGQESAKRKVGDTLKGELFISLVIKSKKVDEELSHVQNYGYAGIEAVVCVTEVDDCDAVYAKNSIYDEEILIEFEQDEDYKEGDLIWVSGSLEIGLDDE